jgi:nitrate reductase NapAB chaperone NapD
MHYSGILVRSSPDRLDECIAQVDACEGVDVYLTRQDISSLVAVIESETLAGQEDRLRAVQELSAVAAADLVYHRSDDDHDLEARP